VFQGYGRPWGYRPNCCIAGYGAAIGGTGIAGALLRFLCGAGRKPLKDKMSTFNTIFRNHRDNIIGAAFIVAGVVALVWLLMSGPAHHVQHQVQATHNLQQV
jgi:hypothetical protein